MRSLFLFDFILGSHTPSEAVQSYFDIYANGADISNLSNRTKDRYIFQAQTTQTDAIFKSIVDALKSNDLWDDTLLIFASDNGAHYELGDSSPLRGTKTTMWEGGIRTPCFISGGYLPSKLRGKIFDSYPIHVVDLFPTILDAAGLTRVFNKNELDGRSMWNLLQTSTKDSTETFDTVTKFGSDRMSIYDTFGDELDAVKMGLIDSYEGSVEELIGITDDRTILINVNNNGCNTDICGALIYGGRWKLIYGTNDISDICDWDREWERSTNDILGCGSVPTSVRTTMASTGCSCESSVCLFDLLNDPCEYYNVASNYSTLTSTLYSKLKDYYDEQTTPLMTSVGDVTNISKIDPTNSDGSIGFWGPWNECPDWRELEFEKKLEQYYENTDDSYNYNAEAIELEMEKNRDIDDHLVVLETNGMSSKEEKEMKEEKNKKKDEYYFYNYLTGILRNQNDENFSVKKGGNGLDWNNNKFIIVGMVATLSGLFCVVYLFRFVRIVSKDSKKSSNLNENIDKNGNEWMKYVYKDQINVRLNETSPLIVNVANGANYNDNSFILPI